MDNCPFCAIANGSIPSYKVYEDPIVIAVLDINPASRGHTLVFTRTHYESIYDIPQQEYLHLMSIARAIGFALKQSMKATDVDILYTRERNKGNKIPHAIVMLVPRYDNDKIAYSLPTESGIDLNAIQNLVKGMIEAIKSGNPPVEAKEEKPQSLKQEQTEKSEQKTEQKTIELKKKKAFA